MEQLDKSNEVMSRILEVGLDLFRQYGIRAITMDEIATQTGMSKKTLYAHFTDKDELVTTVIRNKVESMQAASLAFQQEGKDAINELLLIMRHLNGLFRNLNPIIILDMQKYHPNSYKLFVQHMEGFVLNSIRENLLRGIREGLYREDVDIDVISRVRLESTKVCFHPDMFPKDRYEMGHVQRELLIYYLFGISTLKGYKLILKYKDDFLNKKYLNKK